MQKISNGEPVVYTHYCSKSDIGRQMTADELYRFSEDILIEEYKKKQIS